MSRATWLALWTAATIILIAMIELRPLWGLSSALFLSLITYATTLARLAKRQENENEANYSPRND